MWKEGTFNGYRYWAKVYPEPSRYGIDFGDYGTGKISKLVVRKDGELVCQFNRGDWVRLPFEEDDLDNVAEIIQTFN